jgi:hypothetical protein
MGQASVDLPDPLEKPKTTGSTDELLAQLAGDEIDRLLANGDAGMSPATVPAAPMELPAADVSPALEEPSQKREEIPTSDAEQSALAVDEVAQQSADLLAPDTDVPVVLKPLVWLSSPLEAFPEQVRETIGKIAVLTLVNAIAVLAYVIIYRRHH